MLRLVLISMLVTACDSGGSSSTKMGLGGNCSLGGNSVCASGFCAQLDSGAAVCSVSCGGSSACPAGWSCRDDRSPSVCVPSANVSRCESDASCPFAHVCTASGDCLIPGDRSPCVRCADSGQCAAGLVCAAAGPGLATVCAEPCNGDACSDGLTCIDGACIPQDRCGLSADLCSSCQRDTDCGGPADQCVRNLQLGVSYCGRACESGACPDGFRCQDLEFGAQCVPEDGSCQDRCAEDKDCPLGFACTEGRCGALAQHRGLCAPCGDDGDCADGRCVQGSDGRNVCAPNCGPGETCGVGGVCGAAAGLDTPVCLPVTGRCPVGVGATGRRCAAAEECATGLCLRGEGSSGGRCVAPCDDGQCDVGQQCATVAGRQICLDRGGADGAPCVTGATCTGGLCVGLASESICASPCSASSDCGEGWTCHAVSGDRSACLPVTEGGGIGAICNAGPASCATGLCLVRRDGPVCTQRCSTAADCPADWGCGFAEGRGMPSGGASVCQPNVSQQ